MTTLIYYFDRWRGPIISNRETNDLIYFLIDSRKFKSDLQFFRWYWRIAMDE